MRLSSLVDTLKETVTRADWSIEDKQLAYHVAEDWADLVMRTAAGQDVKKEIRAVRAAALQIQVAAEATVGLTLQNALVGWLTKLASAMVL